MPIKAKRELICQRCGKTFYVECSDNITTTKDLKKISSRFCFKCKMLNILGIRRRGI